MPKSNSTDSPTPKDESPQKSAAQTSEAKKSGTSTSSAARSGNPAKSAAAKGSGAKSSSASSARRNDRSLRLDGAPRTSIVRVAICLLLLAAGIAWIAVYTNQAMDHANWISGFGVKEPANPIPWMSKLKLWNYAIGFGAILVALWTSAHESTPLGRGTGVVVGMLGCLLLGLIWIVVFYLVGGSSKIPVMNQIGQWNLGLGMAFIASSFAFATKWK